jgi:DNA-binding beta-propeller fold protein YncE
MADALRADREYFEKLALDDGWGDRPRGTVDQTLIERVLLKGIYQARFVDALGLCSTHLAAVCRSFCTVVAERRAGWDVLERDGDKEFGSHGAAPGQFSRPCSVAALPHGGVCVVDADNCRLQVFSKEDANVFQHAAPRTIGTKGRQQAQFAYPRGAASDGAFLYVADRQNHRVQKLRLADGEHLRTVGKKNCSEGDSEGQFYFPGGLCVAESAQSRPDLFVCDRANHRIVVLGTDLSWRYTIGHEGRGDGEFDGPTGVTMLAGELYVTDQGNHRVQVFAPPDRRGRMCFARAFGGDGFGRRGAGEGKAPGQFTNPWDVAAVRGLLVVSDETRLQVLTPKGVPLQVLAHTSSCSGICADAQRVWVTDSYRNRVIVLKIREAV